MKFEDSPFDFQSVFETLCRVEKLLQLKMPSCRSYSPYMSGDLDGIESAYIYLGEEVAYVWSEISEAVSLYIQTGKWGRQKKKTAFWLREFLHTSIVYFLAARKMPPYAECTLSIPERVKPCLGKTDQEVLEWLLRERWGEYIAPLWMKNNASGCVYTESWNTSQYSEYEEGKYRQALDGIPDWHFVWNPDGSYYQKHRSIFPYNCI